MLAVENYLQIPMGGSHSPALEGMHTLHVLGPRPKPRLLFSVTVPFYDPSYGEPKDEAATVSKLRKNVWRLLLKYTFSCSL